MADGRWKIENERGSIMKRVVQLISLMALAATILPALMYTAGSMDLPTVKTTMLIATVVWFIATPMWMDR
jgi:hypothetical protein